MKKTKNNLHILLILITIVCMMVIGGCKCQTVVTYKPAQNTSEKIDEKDTNSDESSTEGSGNKTTEKTTDSNTTSNNKGENDKEASDKNESETLDKNNNSGTDDGTTKPSDTIAGGEDDSSKPTNGNGDTGNSGTDGGITTEKPSDNQNTTTDNNSNNTTTGGQNTTSTTTENNNSGTDDKKEYGTFPKPVTDVGITAADSVESAVNKIISKNIKSTMSIEEKIKILHDYLVYTVDYDVEGFMKYVATGDMANSFPPEVFTAKGALIDKVAVCEGYSEAFRLLMNKIGVKNIIVYGTGNGNSHAWNMVQINGYWYHVDVTFDDPCTQGVDAEGNYVMTNQPGGKNISYTYFLTTDDIIKNDHTIDKSETERRNSDVIASYPSSKANDKTFLEMVYPWYEIVSVNELKNLKKYFDKGIYEIRIVTDRDVYDSDKFWGTIGEFGYSYSAKIGSLGDKVVVQLKIIK